jgi:hypothetical protein
MLRCSGVMRQRSSPWTYVVGAYTCKRIFGRDIHRSVLPIYWRTGLLFAFNSSMYLMAIYVVRRTDSGSGKRRLFLASTMSRYYRVGAP